MEYLFTGLLTLTANHYLLQNHVVLSQNVLLTCDNPTLQPAPLTYNETTNEHLLALANINEGTCRYYCEISPLCFGLLHFTDTGRCILFKENQIRRGPNNSNTTSYVQGCSEPETTSTRPPSTLAPVSTPSETDGGSTQPEGQDSGPGGQDSGPGGQDSGPGGQDSGPGGPDSGPGGQDSGPGGQDSGPGGQDSGLVGQDSGPIQGNRGRSSRSAPSSHHPADLWLYMYGGVSGIAGLLVLFFAIVVHRSTRKNILSGTDGNPEGHMTFNIQFPDFFLPNRKKKKKKKRGRGKSGGSADSEDAASEVSTAVPTAVNAAAKAVGGAVYKVKSQDEWNEDQKAYMVRDAGGRSYVIQSEELTEDDATSASYQSGDSEATDLTEESEESEVDLPRSRRNSRVHVDSFGAMAI